MLWPSLNFQQSGKASCLKGLWSKLARNLRDECSKNVCLIWYILLDSLAPLPTKVLVVDPSPWPGVGSTARVFASNVGHGVGPPRTDNEYRARMMIWWKSIFTYVGTYCCLPLSLEILPWHSKFKAHPPTAHVCSVLCLVIYMIYVQCKTCQELSGLPSLFLLHLLGIDSLKASAQSYQDNIYPTLYFSTK